MEIPKSWFSEVLFEPENPKQPLLSTHTQSLKRVKKTCNGRKSKRGRVYQSAYTLQPQHHSDCHCPIHQHAATSSLGLIQNHSDIKTGGSMCNSNSKITNSNSNLNSKFELFLNASLFTQDMAEFENGNGFPLLIRPASSTLPTEPCLRRQFFYNGEDLPKVIDFDEDACKGGVKGRNSGKEEEKEEEEEKEHSWRRSTSQRIAGRNYDDDDDDDDDEDDDDEDDNDDELVDDYEESDGEKHKRESEGHDGSRRRTCHEDYFLRRQKEKTLALVRAICPRRVPSVSMPIASITMRNAVGDFLLSIPVEILEIILGHLDIQSIARCAQVNRLWRSVIDLDIWNLQLWPRLALQLDFISKGDLYSNLQHLNSNSNSIIKVNHGKASGQHHNQVDLERSSCPDSRASRSLLVKQLVMKHYESDKVWLSGELLAVTAGSAKERDLSCAKVPKMNADSWAQLLLSF